MNRCGTKLYCVRFIVPAPERGPEIRYPIEEGFSP